MVRLNSFLEILVLFFLISACTPIHEEQNKASDSKEPAHLEILPKQLLEAGLALEANAKYDSALINYKQAAQIYFEKKDWPNYHHLKNKIGWAFYNLGQNDSLLAHFKEQYLLADSLLGTEDSLQAEAISNYGEGLSLTGKNEEALVLHRQALNLRKKLYGAEHDLVAYSIRELGHCYSRMRQNDLAIEYYEESQLIWEKLGREYSENIGWSFQNIGNCLRWQKKYEEAIQSFLVAKDIWEELYGGKHTNIGAIFNLIGHCYYNQNGYDKAIDYYWKAKTAWDSLEAPNQPGIAWAYNNIANSYNKKNDYKSELKYMQKALEARKAFYGNQDLMVATSYKNVGYALYRVEEYEKSVEYHHKALAIELALLDENDSRLNETYRSLSYCYGSFGLADPYKQLEYIDKALDVIKPRLEEETLETAYTYFAYGQALSEVHIYDKAFIYLKKALYLFIKILGKWSEDVGTAYDSIGYCYGNMGDKKNALKYYKLGLEVYERVFPDAHAKKGTSHFHIGRASVVLKDYDLVLTSAQKALENWEPTIGEDHSRTNLARGLLARYWRENGEAERAEEYYKEELYRYEKVFGKKHSEVSIVNLLLGSIAQREKKDYQTAMEYYHKGLLASLYDFHDPDIYSIPKTSNNHTSGFRHFNALSNKAYGFKEWYKESNDLLHLKASLDHYILYKNWIEFTRKQYDLSIDKAFLTQSVVETYERAVQVAFELYETTEETQYLEIAFDFTEGNKSILLNETRNGDKALKYAGMPAELRNQERELNNQISFLLRRINNEEEKGDTANITFINNSQAELFSRQLQLDSLINVIKRDYPKYYHRKYELQPATVEDIQNRLLDDSTAMVEYFFGEENLLILTITRKEIKGQNIAIDTTFKKALKDYLVLVNKPMGIKDEDGTGIFHQFTSQSYGFYQQLLEGSLKMLDARVKNLIIVPDGILGYLPFNTLLTDSVATGSRINYAALPYLLRQYQLRFGFSATLLLDNLDRPPSKGKQLYTGFAPTYKNGAHLPKDFELDQVYALAMRDGLDTLFHNQPEVEFASKIFKGQAFFGEKATENQYRANGSESRIIHLAMHTTLDDKDPLLSGLVFSREDTLAGTIEDSIAWVSAEPMPNDGFLRAYEIYDIPLQAELAVLSACNTGVGQLQHGEGIMSLGRAFAYAGCPNLVMSLWQANDQSTRMVMENFFRNIKAGHGKDAALRKAQLDYLDSTTEWDFPFYWAGFIMIGDDQPIKVPKQANWKWYLGALILIGTMSFLWIKKRRVL